VKLFNEVLKLIDENDWILTTGSPPFTRETRKMSSSRLWGFFEKVKSPILKLEI
jgi:hypothetical protein